MLPAEHGTTAMYELSSDDHEDLADDVDSNAQHDIVPEKSDKTGHDYPFNRVHYMPCFLCEKRVVTQ